MKKSIILSITILLIKAAFSQGSNPNFGIGGKAGLNITYFPDNYSIGQSSTGANAGIVGVMDFGKTATTSLVAEILFNQKGGTNRVSGRNQISAIDIPILFRFSKAIKDELPLKLFFNAGPYIGLNFYRKSIGEVPLNYAKDFTSNLLELGLCGGLGVMYPIGPGVLMVEFRHGFSLTNVVPKSLESNQITSFSLGYIYYMKGQSQEKKDKKIDAGFE